MQNNLTEKEIETINKWAKKYDIRDLKIKNKEEIFNLKELSIYGFKNIKNFPAEIFKLINLEKLDISVYDLTELPKEIGNLTNLKCLIIQSENLKLPEEICNLSNLESLHIDCGNLESLPSEIEKLINLKTLHIICYNLKRLPKEIHNLINLELLYIACPNLENFPDGIEKLINLKSINITGKLNLKYLMEGIVKLNNLKWLYINTE